MTCGLTSMGDLWMSKPWGAHAVIHQGDGWAVKVLFVLAGEELSWQTHRLRSEKWTVIDGLCEAGCWQPGDEPGFVTLAEGDVLLVPQGWVHTVRAVENTTIVEVIEGVYDEDDIVRLSDRYGR